jgi:D-alanine-D-alanine ligase
MKICVLQPDYSTTHVDYKNYDPARDLAPLLPGHQVDHVFLNKLTTYKQLRECSKKNYDIYVNLCEGYLEWEVPSVEVIYFLELLNLPFTGPTSKLYDPPKELMKYVAYTEGVKTPAYALIEENTSIQEKVKHLSYPLFVKPGKAGDSLGVDDNSLVRDEKSLIQKIDALFDEYAPLLVEEYIDGREFTVMVAADPSQSSGVKTFLPIEYVFPEGSAYKTYSLKTSSLHPECNIPVTDKRIDRELREAATRIFKCFGGVGYARMDFRMKNDVLYFLEINFTCSVFYTDGYEGSADYILKVDGTGQKGFLNHIISEGINRHQGKQKKYEMRGNSIAGFGIYAKEKIQAGSVVFRGEERAQRIVTKRHVENTWTEEQKEIFMKYAYPVSDEVFILWDEDPSEWAPQNHSCNPNTAYQGLDVIALRNIDKGEELTLDYAGFLGEDMEPFQCACGESNCKGHISGVPSNSVTARESASVFNK